MIVSFNPKQKRAMKPIVFRPFDSILECMKICSVQENLRILKLLEAILWSGANVQVDTKELISDLKELTVIVTLSNREKPFVGFDQL